MNISILNTSESESVAQIDRLLHLLSPSAPEVNLHRLTQLLKDEYFKLNEDEYPLDLGYYEYIMGASSAQGYPLADASNGQLDFTNSYIIYLFNRMKDFYNNFHKLLLLLLL